VATGRLIGQTPPHKSPYEYRQLRAAFVPRTRWFATTYREKVGDEGATNRGEIAYWDCETLHFIPGIGKYVVAAVSPDGRRAVVVSDEAAWLIDTASFQPVSRPVWHRDSKLVDWFDALGRAWDFSPDGRLALFWTDFGQDRLIDAQTGQYVGKTLQPHESAQFTPDGRTLILAYVDRDKDVQVFEHLSLAPVEGDPERITLWVQTLLGKELTAAGEVRQLEDATLGERRLRLAKLGGPPLSP
jgi:hypothetical protein